MGSLAGLTPTPYASGQIDHEQGISKAGNKRMRWMAVEIAWGWLHFQPDSELSRWFYARFGRGSSRQRRIGIVALARKLLVQLWKIPGDGCSARRSRTGRLADESKNHNRELESRLSYS